MTERLVGGADRGRVLVSTDGDGIRITLTGDIDMLAQQELDRATEQVARRPAGAVTVDMGDTDFLASCGVQFLAQLYNAVHPAGHQVILLDPPRIVRRVLDITGVGDILTIAHSNEKDTG